MILRFKRRTITENIMLMLGILSATDIVYLFVVGSTPILLVYVFSFLSILLLSFSTEMRYRLNYAIRSISKDLVLLVSVCFLSVINVLLQHPDGIKHWFVGIIELFMLSCVVLITIMCSDAKEDLFQGFYVGLILNVIMSVVALILFNAGISFSLKSIFPGVTSIVTLSGYSAMGFFKEPGHFMRWFASIFLLILWKKRTTDSNRGILFFIIVTLFVIAFTRSAASSIFAVAIVYYVFKTHLIKLNAKNLLIGFIIVLLISFLGLSGEWERLGIDSLINGSVLDIFAKTNGGERASGMRYAFEIVKKYFPFGCGWNMFSTCFIEEGYYNSSIIGATWGRVLGSYSGILTMLSDIGAGTVFYVYFALSKSIKLIRKNDEYSISLGVSMLILFALFCCTNFQIEPVTGILIGLILAELQSQKGNSLERQMS